MLMVRISVHTKCRDGRICEKVKSVKCKVRIRASLGLGILVVGIRVDLTLPKTLTVIQQVRW